MMGILLLAVNVFLFTSAVKAENNGSFPSGFLFGVGTSAYQIEGAWNEDGKGENIWDHWVHDSVPHIENNDTGDIASDFYHQYELDVALAGVLNVSHFLFSISWSRILPNGKDLNVDGILYYRALLVYIIERGMIPVATLYHYDLPQPLQDIGGWTNPEMVDYFATYAKAAFQHFEKVGYWLTFNGPRSVCRLGYGEGVHAPGITLDGTGEYMCAYVLLNSHAAVYHMYKNDFPSRTAKMSIAIDLNWSEPASNSSSDIEAAERRNLFEFGLYANPIYKGNWPQVVIDRVGNRSENENFTSSRLPQFTQQEIDYIKGTFDYVAVNMFHTNLVADIAEPEYGDPGYMKDMKANVSINPSWEVAADGNAVVPWGSRKSLKWLKDTYGNSEILITGNGVSVAEGYYGQDPARIDFYTQHLSAILDALYEDNVNVIGYTAWSLLDGFEWNKGYSQHYGFLGINFTSPSRNISVRDSFLFYRRVVTDLQIPGYATTTATTTTVTTTTEPSTTPAAASKLSIYPVYSLLIIIFYYLLQI